MAAIQNFKNFLRHGKQARAANSPHGEATTNVSNVHAQQQRYNNYAPPPPADHHYAHSDPNVLQHKPLQANAYAGDYSAAVIDNRNVAARAGDAAARAAGDHQKAQVHDKAGAVDRKADYDPTVLERIIAEERESKGKLPRYPGLERWTLLEKMGDGAFSNVYRAKDNTGQYPECAIKVVRKFEMNSSQVSQRIDGRGILNCVLLACLYLLRLPFSRRISFHVHICKFDANEVVARAINIFIPTSRRCRRLWRCATLSHSALSTVQHDDCFLSFASCPGWIIVADMMTFQRANILKEVQIMRQLDHPNIVKLIEFSESRQYYYIILELCPGGELFHQIVRLTYFSEDLSRHVIVQVAKALEYLHEEAGVVHR